MKHAICIGINNYDWLRPSASLRGCVADALDWGRLLHSSFGFTSVNYLFDGAATPQAFRSALSYLAERTRPGDIVAVTYSGHGTRIPDEDGDEDDCYDEAIVLSGAIYPDDAISGDLKIFPDGVHVVFVSDSCHSGTVHRLLGTAADSLPKCVDVFGVTPDATRRRVLHHRFCAPRDPAAGDNLVLLSGCKDAETSMDAYVAGAYHGALSFHACRILEETPALTWRDFHAELCRRIAATSPQNPQLTISPDLLDRRVFG